MFFAKIIYLHLTHPFQSAATSIHKPTSHIHQQSWQMDGKEPLEWCQRHHPLTPMVIFISLERPPGDCQFSLFAHHQLGLFGLLESVRQEMKLKSWSFYQKMEIEILYMGKFLSFLTHFPLLFFSKPHRRTSQLWLVLAKQPFPFKKTKNKSTVVTKPS